MDIEQVLQTLDRGVLVTLSEVEAGRLEWRDVPLYMRLQAIDQELLTAGHWFTPFGTKVINEFRRREQEARS